MKPESILLPPAVLALWTLAVLLLIPLHRIRAARAGRVTSDDFKYGESPRVPPEVAIPNRHMMNLLELPVLFYMSSLFLYVMRATTPSALALAWAYVGLRLGHSVVHLSYNKVMHRLALFALSNVVLVSIWMRILVLLLK